MALRRLLIPSSGWLAATFMIVSPLFATTIDVFPGDLIGDALGLAAGGDTVAVHCGVYAEQGLTIPAGVTLRSADGDPDCVTIATSGGAPIFTCENQAPAPRIEGITFTAVPGGITAAVVRGAALLITNSSPQITDCVFDNLSAGYGGAVYCGEGAAPFFLNCEFTNNHAWAAGGALNSIGSAAPVLANCLLAANSCDGQGHAINAVGGSQPVLVSCTLADNAGAALVTWDTGSVNLNNGIVSGTAWVGDPSAIPSIACSDLYNGGAPAWTGLLSAQAGLNGNIAENPLFCGTAGGAQPYSLAENSPCTDSATGGCGRMGAFPIGCGVSGVDDDLQSGFTPLATRLLGNYPNPFNPSTTIRYDLRKSGPVEITVFDLAGRKVRQLVKTHLTAGRYDVRWNGNDATGRPVAAGVYFYQLKTNDAVDTNRLSLIK